MQPNDLVRTENDDLVDVPFGTDLWTWLHLEV